MQETASFISRNTTGSITLVDRFRSGSTLSILLSVLMAVPSNIPLNFAFDPPTVSRESAGAIGTRITRVRKLDRISLLGWADGPTVGDNAEEADETPLPPAEVSRVFDLACLVPSSTHGHGPRRPEVPSIGLRNPPLRC